MKKKQKLSKKSVPQKSREFQERTAQGWSEIARFLGQPLRGATMARSGMPVAREGRFMYATREERISRPQAGSYWCTFNATETWSLCRSETCSRACRAGKQTRKKSQAMRKGVWFLRSIIVVSASRSSPEACHVHSGSWKPSFCVGIAERV